MDQNAEFADLLLKVRQGDAQAAADLVRLYEPEVRRFVRHRLNSPKMRRLLDSLDVCQSVFANFFARVGDGQFDLRHPLQLQQLLMTMAGNRLLDHVRQQTAARRGGAQANVGQESAWVADPGPGPHEALETRDLVDLIRSRLSAEEIALLDPWMNGEEWPSIGERMGASAEALRKRFTRAIDRVSYELGLENLL
jgi:DNA-directed RNA polymerase specialized sigma24 family protein